MTATRKSLQSFADMALNPEVNRLSLESKIEQNLIPDCPDDHSTQRHIDGLQKIGTWCYYYQKFVSWWAENTHNGLKSVPFSIFRKGNGKLPCWSFSTCPGKYCPGAGDCLNWCYSFKAWRYPAAYFRQVQNLLLVRNRPDIVRQAFQNLPQEQTVRLYVDGDFDSLTTMIFWFETMQLRPDLQVYGYSKSWKLFLDYDKLGRRWPTNYTLNLSSGSKYPKTMVKLLEKLPIPTGEFLALPAASKMPARRTEPAKWSAWAKALKDTAKRAGIHKSFVCPGKCGDCLPKGAHACGSKKFRGTNSIPVLIGIH